MEVRMKLHIWRFMIRAWGVCLGKALRRKAEQQAKL